MTIGFLTAVAQWYPAPASGFFLKGGVGLGTASDEATLPGFGSVKLESTGFAYHVGTGYDIRLARNFSISPYVGYLATLGANAKVNGASADEKLNVNVLQFGLGFTWH